jgi:hypothetical protein
VSSYLPPTYQPVLNCIPPALVVQDDFYDDPDGVRAFALQQPFQANLHNHKGQRSLERFLFPGIQQRFEALLGVRIVGWEVHGYNGIFQFCVPSDPLVFHSDQQRWAGAVYLTPDAPLHTGTAFYRSKETKLRRPPSVTDAIRAGTNPWELERRTYGGKLLDPTAWELVDQVGNVYNRLVLWDGCLIHAATGYFGQVKEDARLFQLFFFGSV